LNFPGTSRLGAAGFSVGAKGYVGMGSGSGSFSDFYEYTPINVGVQEDGEREIIVTMFPNPSNGVVTITSEMEIDLLEIYDTAGAKIWEQDREIESTTVDLAPFSKGVYFVKVRTGNKTVIKKLIIH
jgi:hypothetical protein